MTDAERGEIMTGLLKLQADAAVLLMKCQMVTALEIGINVQAVKNLLDEALTDLGVPREQPLLRPWTGKY